MKTNKNVLEEYLYNKLKIFALDNKKGNEFCKNIEERHGVPLTKTMDFIADRVPFSETTEFELYCMLEEFDETKLSKYFTDTEINTYSKTKQQESTGIKFPIIIKCVQITPDQYIGKMDTDFLMKLKSNQMISYNTNAQRTMQRIVRGAKEFYRISLNKNAVAAIRKSFESNEFIPNTITLNMPIREDVSFRYDSKNSELIINSIKSFDISDGYHRYVAISQIKNADPNWNYPMEIRITNFSEEKTRNLIFQEDQKTKMRKVDSDSMNSNQGSNIVTERLNQDTMCNFAGSIQRNGGQINFAEFSSVLNYLYFKNKPGTTEVSTRIRIQQEVKDGLNAFSESDEKWLKHIYNFKELCILLYGIYNKKTPQEILNALSKQDELNAKKFYTKIPKKTTFNEIEKLY